MNQCAGVIKLLIQMPVLQKAGGSINFHKAHVPIKFIYFENNIISFYVLPKLFAFGTISTRKNSF
jgi:hypothetical protein